MGKIRLIIVLVACLTASNCFCQDARHFYTEAKKAQETKDYPQFLALIMKAHELHPYHQGILWNAGVAAALNNKLDQAIDFLNRALNIDATFDLNTPELTALKDHSGFLQLRKTKENLLRSVVTSDTAFVLDDRQLHLESVAFDEKDKVLYGGSIHKRKIIKINRDGRVSDFVSSEQDGITGVFGLKVDSQKRVLWVCSSPVQEMQHYDSTAVSKLYKFSLSTGHLVQAYQPADTLSGHIFGDITLDSKGIPFVSDSKNNHIYKYDAKLDKLVSFFSSKEFWSIQGLSFSENDQFLYISDYVKGIYRLTMKTLDLIKVTTSYDISLKGTDGIQFYKNSLITIQNGVQPNRVVRHYLDDTGERFIRSELIDNAHPAFGEPTIGSLSNGVFYYVANSQWSGYENGKIKDNAALKPIVILKHNLVK
jgi:sugar lactone lactonase YvrE